MPLPRTRPLALAALLVAAAPAVVRAQSWFEEERSFSLYEENDAFASSDSSYTQGLRLTWDFAVWSDRWNPAFRLTSLYALRDRVTGKRTPAVTRPCRAQTPRSQRPCGTTSVGIGQTMYTPSNLLIEGPQPNDRPYAGYLFAGVTRSVLFKRSQVSSDVIVGVTGPPSLAQLTQGLAHWTWSSDSPQPQGWDNQLRTMLHVTLLNQSVLPRVVEFCLKAKPCDGRYNEGRVADLTPRTELVIGTLMTRVSPGLTLRLGYNFPDVTGLQRIPTTRSWGAEARSLSPWVMGFGTYDHRFVGHNALLSGSVPDGDPGGWRSIGRIGTDHSFGEYAYGVAVGFRYATVVRQWVTRGGEYSPAGGAHRFGAMSLSIHAPARAP